MSSLDHIGIYVKDLEKSLRFYKRFFGFKEKHRFSVGKSNIVVLGVGSSLLELIQRSDASIEGPKGSWSHIAFKIDDYDAMISKLEDNGLKLRKLVLENGSKIAFFKDPDAHDIEIMENGLLE